MEYPPLWVWAIVVGIIIATKLILRWQATKEIAKEAINRPSTNDEIKDANLDDFHRNSSTKIRNIRSYKYGPFRLYRGGFVTWKKRR